MKFCYLLAIPALAMAQQAEPSSTRDAERAFTVAQQSPRIPVGEAGRATRGRERPGLLDADEERGQPRNERRSVLPAQLPMGVDRDLEHRIRTVAKNCCE